jgi:hypothetical protein
VFAGNDPSRTANERLTRRRSNSNSENISAVEAQKKSFFLFCFVFTTLSNDYVPSRDFDSKYALFSLNSSVSINLHKFCYNSDDG